ncbi:MAG: aminotransferase class IV, partial [Candidatus Omnitrophica bacterium]|nr:aminotransferase class IV [Candidatus Omnitrophota bacterium]
YFSGDGMNKVWINKKLFNANEARISIFDRGFMYGDGIFETMRSYSGKVFEIDGHLDRLGLSLKTIGIKNPYSKIYLKKEIYRLLGANALKDAYIRLTVTRGEGRFGIERKDRQKPNVIIFAKKFEGYPGRVYRKGISVRVVSIKQDDLSPLSGIKSLNFLGHIIARFQAKDAGADEAIILNTRACVAEAATSNVFTVKRGVIITPSLESGILPGITRAVIIRLAKRFGLKVIEKSLPHKELLSSDEIFLTNSLAGVLPVISVDGKKIGRGIPGELTKLLHISYRKEALR